MNILYDGSFDGLLTAIFEYYPKLERITIKTNDNQLGFLDDTFIKTDYLKSDRVKNGVIENFGYSIMRDFETIFKSKFNNKENIIARCVKGLYKNGLNYLNSAEEPAIEYRRIIKNYWSENHDYKGLLRFRSIQEGFLYAEFEPENDILESLVPHFKRRMPNEKFLIFDKSRKKAAITILGQTEYVEVIELTPEDSPEEEIFKEAWRKFYDAVSIKERENNKLMISNMPKKYWKYLPERNDLI